MKTSPLPSKPKHLSLTIARYPVKMLHYLEFGVLLGAVLALGIHNSNKQEYLPDVVIEEQVEKLPDLQDRILIVSGPTEADFDTDNDGIPDAWEIEFHHNPNDASDAGADFNNDGLTALQEYQLWLRTTGQAGNPLGKWAVEEISIEQPTFDTSEYTYFEHYSYVTAANDRGDVVVQLSSYGEKLDGSWSYSERSAFLLADGTTQEIQIPGKTSGYTVASDINELGEVLLQWHSEDWSSYESYILKSDNTVTQLTLNGNACYAYRMNNFGDWIGYEITEDQGWLPVQVVDGMRIIPHDSFTWWWVADINDYGQIIGSYYDVMENKYLTFTQLGSLFFSTGREGDMPLFNESSQWQWPAAMNQWGEFAGGAYGYNSQGQWRNSTFFFDGAYHDIKGQTDEYYSYPADLSDAGMVLFNSYAPNGSNYHPYLWRDSVSVNCDLLLPAGYLSENGGHVQPTKLTPNGKVFLTRYDASWQTQSIIILTPDQDSDGDGMPDDWEEFYGFDPNTHDANLDSDGDGTNNLGEFLLRSDPHAAPVIDPNGEPIDTRPGVDTDGDGIPNNWEVVNGMNYEDPTDAALDFDRDGYTNLQEFRLNTDPRGAPSYRIRQLGPFPGVSSVALSSATLGNGVVNGNPTYFSGDQVTEEVFFPAYPSSGGAKPAFWSQARSAETGQFSFYTTTTNDSRSIVAQSPSGAMLTRHGYNPVIFTYWSSPTATPITLSGAASANNINYLYNATFSPTGNYLFASRSRADNSSLYEPIAWKMPSSSSVTYKPVTITAPAGASIGSWLNAFINDYGIIAANGTVSGQTRALVWTLNTTATSLQGTILPNLSNNGFTNTVGLSNHSNPIIAGTALISGNQQRATVWKYNSPTSFIVTNLGTLPNGNFSNIAKISPNGTLAGISNTLSGNALKQQIFCATPVIPADSYSIDPTLYRIIPQGEPSASSLNITHLTNAGEIIATHYSATSQQIKSLLRQGKSYPLDSILPPSSGYALETIKSINSQGTLFVTAWKDGAQSHLLLTPDRDTDGDGLPDAFENEHSFNPFAKNTPNADTDSDGLTDIEEFRNGTKPRNPDSDSDGMKDGWEVEWGLLPLDPTDALLDPDEDRVTNLRESQIGTIPTGIHKLEILHTDTAWQYPQILATGDDGTLIRTGSYTWNDLSTESLYGYGYTQEILTQKASTIVTLPTNQGSYSYSNDWTYYTGSDSSGNYYPDATSGQIHGNIYRYNSLSDSNTGEYVYEEAYYLTPDIANFPDEADWISLETVQQNLRNSDLHDGSPPLSEYEYLYPNEISVSPSGTRRIHSTDWGQQFLLNERGEFLELLPNDHSWQKINDYGIAACYQAWNEPSANGSTHTYRPWLFLSDGQSFLLPHDPSSTAWPDWELLGFSNDGIALLRNGYRYNQYTWTTRYFIFDTNLGTLDLTRLPSCAYPTVSSLSNQNERLLIHGDKPSQITPDGTCIRLDALRILDSNNVAPVPLRAIYSRTLRPTHIASDGRITLTTTNSAGQTVILQIIKHNDTNNDGLPDDWALANNVIEPEKDDDTDGLSNIQEYQLGTDPSNPDTDGDGIPDAIENDIGTDPKKSDSDNNGIPDGEEDADGDGIRNKNDADPKDSIVNWHQTGRPSFAVIEIPVDDAENLRYADHSAKGSILFARPKEGEPDTAVIIDKNQVVHEIPYQETESGKIGIWVTHLHDDLVPAWNRTEHTDQSMFDPLTGIYHPWVCPTGYQDDISDVRDGVVVGTNWPNDGGIFTLRHSPNGDALPGESEQSQSSMAYIDRDGNIASDKRYWTKMPDGKYEVKNLPEEVEDTYTADVSCAILKQTIDGNENKWALVVRHGSFEGLLISENGENFCAATQRFSNTKLRTVTRQGWIFNDEFKVWTGQRWETLLEILGEDYSKAELLGINDDGLAVAKIKKHNQPMKIGLLVPAEAVPDYNRDGVIDHADRGKITNDKPWRFWSNTDDDSGTEGGTDIQNSEARDCINVGVDGVRDLVDFFPVHFDLKTFLAVFPETEYEYYLKHESQAFFEGITQPAPTFNVIWYPEAVIESEPTGSNGVGSYLKNIVRATDIAGRSSNVIPQFGLQIPTDILNAAKNDQGVMLFEARFSASNPILMEIRKQDGTVIAKYEMPVRISDVESMFRTRFLAENLGGGTQGDMPGQPENWPDYDRNGKHFIFVHGYNVSGEQSRGWNGEVFKRMFWSGSNAMFTGVAWHGNESQVGTSTPDYWRNVHNAFQTSKSMADFVNALPGSGKCIAAHSLGNVVVSSAIKDHGMNVSNYYMVDAAAAIEAYSGASTLGNAEMSRAEWRSYDEKLWCSEWHKIFPETDNRRHKMTWRDRFGPLPNAYNFHSTGEEVLKNGDGTIPATWDIVTKGGIQSWVKQEMTKGYSLLVGGGLFHNGTGGWDFNDDWYVTVWYPIVGFVNQRMTPAAAANIPLAEQEEKPFFDPFVNEKFHDPALGSAEAEKYDEVSKALAESLPALTFAAGSNPIAIFNVRNIDMMNLRNGWPESRTQPTVDPDMQGWRHSDIRNVAHLYTHKVYEKWIELGELK